MTYDRVRERESSFKMVASVARGGAKVLTSGQTAYLRLANLSKT